MEASTIDCGSQLRGDILVSAPKAFPLLHHSMVMFHACDFRDSNHDAACWSVLSSGKIDAITCPCLSVLNVCGLCSHAVASLLDMFAATFTDFVVVCSLGSHGSW